MWVFLLSPPLLFTIKLCFRVRNAFKKYSETSIVYSILVTVTVLVYWRFQYGLIELIWTFVGCKALQLLWAISLAKDTFSKFSVKISKVLKLLKDSWSFGMFGVLGIAYVMIDTQIISIYLEAKDVALYQAVFRIVIILMLFSEVISNALLPYLSL